MKISCCPQCYEKEEIIIEGKFIGIEPARDEIYDIYRCPLCSEFYNEQ
jgi:hypothetical protein